MEAISQYQISRILKSESDGLHLVDCSFNMSMSQYEFLICGKTSKLYTVCLGPNGKFGCNCPDQKHHGKDNFVCKHICYVLIKVFRYNNIDFFTVKENTLYEGDEVFFNNIEKYTINEDVSKRYLKTLQLQQSFHDKAEKENNKKDEECPICYETLGGSNSLCCPSCSNHVHQACIDKWMIHGTQTCALCRSDLWKHYVPSGSFMHI